MTKRLHRRRLSRSALFGALGVALLVPVGLTGFVAATAPAAYADDSRTWVRGHYEDRETRQVVPAEERREWVPPRVESVTIPAVTERVRVEPVVQRVRVIERVWVPPVVERRWQHGFWDLSGWNKARWEEVVVEKGRYEERPTDRFEDKVVVPARYETRVVTPARTEQRTVADGYWRTVVVRPERVERSIEKVWVPGHWAR